MIAKVISMRLDRGLTVETTLDPAIQPFLHDHQIAGTPVLPGVMGIEAFAEAASRLLPGWYVSVIEDVNFLAPFKFYRGAPRTLVVEAMICSRGEDVVADCKLIGHRSLPHQAETQVTTHFTARVRLTRNAPQANAVSGFRPPEGRTIHSADIYRVYFHGPAYQVVERAWWHDERVLGLLAANLGANHQPPELPTIVSPRFIELCFQTAGVWEMALNGRIGLPQHVDRIIFRSHIRDSYQPAEGTRVYATVAPNPAQGSFDADVIDEKGNVYLQLNGYRTVRMADIADAKRLQELKDVISADAFVEA
jgi:hypothetical protein